MNQETRKQILDELAYEAEELGLYDEYLTFEQYIEILKEVRKARKEAASAIMPQQQKRR